MGRVLPSRVNPHPVLRHPSIAQRRTAGTSDAGWPLYSASMGVSVTSGTQPSPARRARQAKSRCTRAAGTAPGTRHRHSVEGSARPGSRNETLVPHR